MSFDIVSALDHGLNIIFDYDFNFEKEFNLMEDGAYHYVDGEEADKQVKGYFHNEKLFGIWVNYGGDEEVSELTEYGKKMVIEHIRKNIEKVINEKIRIDEELVHQKRAIECFLRIKQEITKLNNKQDNLAK